MGGKRLAAMATLADTDPVPLVLLPGTLCDGRLFAPLLARLPDRSVAVGDLHGLASVDEIAERLLADMPERFALLGFSLGAIVALEVARRAPGRLAGLALIGGTPRDVPADRHAERRRAAAGVRSIEQHVGDALWPGYVGEAGCDAHRELVLDMARSSAADALILQTEVALSRRDARAWLAGVAVPTLVLAGAGDRVNPPPVQAEMAAMIPEAALALVPGAGHFVLLERPDECARAVRRWLDDVDDHVSQFLHPDERRRPHERQQQHRDPCRRRQGSIGG